MVGLHHTRWGCRTDDFNCFPMLVSPTNLRILSRCQKKYAAHPTALLLPFLEGTSNFHDVINLSLSILQRQGSCAVSIGRGFTGCLFVAVNVILSASHLHATSFIHRDALAWLLSLCARGHICLLLGYALTLSQSSSTLKLSPLFYRRRFRFRFLSCCHGRGDGPIWSFYRDPIEYPVGRSDLGPPGCTEHDP